MKKDLLFVLLLILFIAQLPSVAAINETQPIRPYQLSWELETSFLSIDLAPSGEFVVISTNSEIKTLDVKTGKIIQSIPLLKIFGGSTSSEQVTTNGEYIIVNGQDPGNFAIKAFSKNFNGIWSYKEIKNDAKYFPSPSSISLSGNNVISTSYRVTPESNVPTEIVLYFFEEGKLLWRKEFEKLDTVKDVSITSDSDLIAISSSSIGKTGTKIIDKKGEVIKEFEDFNKLKLSSNGKYAIGLRKNKVVYFNINDGSTAWEYNYDGIEEAKSLDQTLDSNLIAIGFNNFFYILNKQGTVIQKYNVAGVVSDIKISLDGKYLLLGMGNKIVMFSNDLPVLISPEADFTFEKETPIFKWENNGALKYFIKIDDDTFEVSKPEFIINGSLSQGEHEWSVEAIYDDGVESMWSYPQKFYYFSDIVPHLTSPDEGKVFEYGNIGNITFRWEYRENITKYILNISGTVYESSTKEFTIPTESFRPRIYRWSVKAVRSDGLESNWSLPKTFSISAPKEKIVQKEVEVFSQLNPRVAFVGSILIIFVIAIFVRPYYKRLKVKREMAKTPTDWCPYCLKFTGGEEICPHCGKITLIEHYSDIMKRKEKKNEK